MKRKPLSSKWVELTSPVGCIPPGVYRLRGQDSGFYQLTVGKHVCVGISEESASKLLPAAAGAKPMTPQQLVYAYYPLYEKYKTQPFNPFGPFTFCGLDPSL